MRIETLASLVWEAGTVSDDEGRLSSNGKAVTRCDFSVHPLRPHDTARHPAICCAPSCTHAQDAYRRTSPAVQAGADRAEKKVDAAAALLQGTVGTNWMWCNHACAEHRFGCICEREQGPGTEHDACSSCGAVRYRCGNGRRCWRFCPPDQGSRMSSMLLVSTCAETNSSV